LDVKVFLKLFKLCLAPVYRTKASTEVAHLVFAPAITVVATAMTVAVAVMIALMEDLERIGKDSDETCHVGFGR
jgi:hypothetical protein